MLSKSKPQRILTSIQETKELRAGDAVRNQKVKGPHSTFGPEHHSAHSKQRSEHYTAEILGGRQSAARITDQLNPDRSISMEAKGGRRYPSI